MSFTKGQRVRCINLDECSPAAIRRDPEHFPQIGYVYEVAWSGRNTVAIFGYPNGSWSSNQFELFVEPGFKVGDHVTDVTGRWHNLDSFRVIEVKGDRVRVEQTTHRANIKASAWYNENELKPVPLRAKWSDTSYHIPYAFPKMWAMDWNNEVVDIRAKCKALILELGYEKARTVLQAMGYQRLTEVPEAKLHALHARLLNLKCALAPPVVEAPKFKVGDWVHDNASSPSTGQIVNMAGGPTVVWVRKGTDPSVIWDFKCSHPEKYLFPAEKPAFMVGDKVTCNWGGNLLHTPATIIGLDGDLVWIKDESGRHSSTKVRYLSFDI